MDAKPSSTISGNALAVCGSPRVLRDAVVPAPDDEGAAVAHASGWSEWRRSTGSSCSSGVMATIGAAFSESTSAASTAIAGTAAFDAFANCRARAFGYTNTCPTVLPG